MRCYSLFAEGTTQTDKNHIPLESIYKGAVYWLNNFWFGPTITEQSPNEMAQNSWILMKKLSQLFFCQTVLQALEKAAENDRSGYLLSNRILRPKNRQEKS